MLFIFFSQYHIQAEHEDLQHFYQLFFQYHEASPALLASEVSRSKFGSHYSCKISQLQYYAEEDSVHSLNGISFLPICLTKFGMHIMKSKLKNSILPFPNHFFFKFLRDFLNYFFNSCRMNSSI